MNEKDDQNLFRVASIIALRKTEFVDRAWGGLRPRIPIGIDENRVRNALERIVATMDNGLFLSQEEKRTKTINPKLDVASLQLNRELLEREFHRLTTLQ